ncbi:MAG: glycosyltransferase [Paracoccus sp. (in: a-proteobacteria)]
MTPAEQLRLIKSSKQIHTNWYKTTYPDVVELGMEPALHYLRYGAAMGRNPGKNFDTRFYLRTCPEAAKSGLNPLAHYVLHGRAKGVPTMPPKSPGAKHVASVRTRLLSLGFTERPLEELADIQANAKLRETRALASRELALWHMRTKTPEGYRTALQHLEAARSDAPDLDFCRKLSVGELMCHYFLGDNAAARATYERAAVVGEVSPDLLLARANLEARPERRVALMNRVLAQFDIAPVALAGDSALPAYDRLTVTEALPQVTDGPKVTVLIAAYEAAETLPTALRSLQEQTWQNLEILVLDDCSPSPDTCRVTEEFAARDPRIRLIRMEQNAGAYVARNRGLDEATGEYITLHDADDWSHPSKIETQVRFMQDNPEVMACTSQQARADSDLRFPRWAGASSTIAICRNNMSSLLVRHAPVFEAIGYWDGVRFGADSEKIQRIKAAFGKHSVVNLATGPLSFQRISETSIASSDAFGFEGFFFGARREYLLAQRDHHEKTLRYTDPAVSNFGVPRIMHPQRSDQSRHFDVIIASEFRMKGGSTRSNLEEIACHAKAGLRTGIVMMNRYDFPDKGVLPEVRAAIDAGLCTVITHGEQATCDLLIVRYPPVLEQPVRYLPRIEARSIKVVVNQPPMSDYGPEAERRYHLETCARNIRAYFGTDATWYPIGPLVRDALQQHHAGELHHIILSDDDWSNVIDIQGWDRGPRKRGPSDTLRIGRHSRDHEHKWPSSREQILAAYPSDPDVEVHVLGGTKTPEALLGKRPANWTVHDFGSLHPRDFLKNIDVWIYFAHPDWVESFGRTIIEAMATGIPVILPEVYRPVFKEAAIYALPEQAVQIARDLHADPAAYEAQSRRAQDYIRTHFSYEVHVARVRAVAAASQPAVAAALQPAVDVSNATAAVATEGASMPRGRALRNGPRKTSSAALSEIAVVDLAVQEPKSDVSSLMTETVGGHRFDYLWAPKPGAERIFVLFSGDAQREKNDPPVFQRWSWAPHFPGHCLYVSDPMLHMHPEMGLAWYAGTEDLDPLEPIIRRVLEMTRLTGLQARDVVAYGSSGGGFAALRMVAMLPEAAAVAINPQTNIVRFKWASPDFYARICLNQPDRDAAMAAFPHRLDLGKHVKELRKRRLVLIQNRVDTHHLNKHYIPFCREMGATPNENRDSGLFRRILFDHEGGHGRAETPEMFAAALDIVRSNFVENHQMRIPA